MSAETDRIWTAESVLELARGYQSAAILAAAADLDLFTALAPGPRSVEQLAGSLGGELRGLAILLDALVALRLLEKRGEAYGLPAELASLLTATGERSVLAMAQHQSNCLRRWAQLAHVIRTGRPADSVPSVRGEQGDLEAFIGAMDNVSAPAADGVIRAIQPLEFQHVLDVGGASGTWTMAFLGACPASTATLFDLPEVLPLARQRLAAAGLASRVQLVGGDFLVDLLPGGADLAWVSAIVHQNSRDQNRRLFANVFTALTPGGRLAIRDIVMDGSRTRPVAGALFAVNMLVATEGGGTFTFDELAEDLQSTGFVGVVQARQDEGMNAVIVAAKPPEVQSNEATAGSP